ncbi:MAG: endonuclease MutS2 [Clostridiales bacterium]|nr:endonuclease MutS2 [Clostridiales bacterium]
MNYSVTETLELNRVLDLLTERTNSALTIEKIAELEPMTNRRMVQDALTETTEAVSVIMYKGSIPVGNITDLSNLIGMVRRGRCLNMRELLLVRGSLAVAREVKTFLAMDMPSDLHIIPELANLIELVPTLENDINTAIISEDEVADTASSELRNIRRDIRNKNEMIRSRLHKMISSSSAKTHLQEAIITMRNGRYVLPVKKEYANLVPGMVHDQSSTGATLFIEPQAVVNLNNELKQLAMDEQAEITKILKRFSERVHEHSQALENNQKILIELDFINAKGNLSCSMEASEPHLNEEGILDIKKGRHPLIDPTKVIPIDVELGRDWTTLLITGPNTGGKTVTLKTIGLITLMAQCGLHIPAEATSDIPVLEEIFADIGDEQSIEQSLSTFSSHMMNIIRIFDVAGPNSLVLLDELGAGTDPLEGAALGIAELEKLRELGALVVATTHYTELKKYALATQGVMNASMEFDIETLSPTYKLRVGLPGKSNAFEISKKLGLQLSIIDRATELLDEEQLEFEDAVSKMEIDRVCAEAALQEADRSRELAEEEKEEAAKQLELARQEASKIIEKSKLNAREMLREAQNVIDDIAAELRSVKDIRSDAGFNDGHIADGVAKGRAALKKAEGRYRQADTQAVYTLQTGKMPDPETLRPGMRIKYIKLNQNGDVETAPDAKGNLIIRIGAIKMNVNVKDLILAESEVAGNKEKKRRRYSEFSYNKSKTIKTEINLIGQNLEDASDLMNKYIDDAFLAGLKTVSVIHGRGEGILRNGLRRELKNNKHVKSFKSAPYDDGGEGCTIVELVAKK